MRWPWGKMLFLFFLVVVYVSAGIGFKMLVDRGVIARAPNPNQDTTGILTVSQVSGSLNAAQAFFSDNLLRQDGHINLYYVINRSMNYTEENFTNSEAVSYYLLWAAQAGDRQGFDNEIKYMQDRMLQPDIGYMMWKLTPDDNSSADMSNDASDADLRAIKALLIAESKWGDPKYTQLIDSMSHALTRVAVTKDGYLAPSGGLAGSNATWASRGVSLSYTDFTVIKALSDRYGEPWKTMYDKMKTATINAQLQNGLYNTELTDWRAYGTGPDKGQYSINNMWIMVRAAESNDKELMDSAKRSLAFYRKVYDDNAGKVYSSYSSTGDPLTSDDPPWVYAIVGRAAAALGDLDFSRKMMENLISYQDTNAGSPDYGAIIEDSAHNPRAGQFTMQESILTMQYYLERFSNAK